MIIGPIETRQDLHCPICDDRMQRVFSLDRYPLTEMYEPYLEDGFDDTGYVDQGLLFCERCSHGKLETVISKDFLYSNYRTSTAGSVGSLNAVRKFHAYVLESVNLNEFDAIIDIGANDASLLNCFGSARKQLIAIDPNANKRLETEFEIRVMSDFIENVDLSALKSSRKLFLCSHTLEHIDQPSSMLRTLHQTMSEADVCVFQFPSLDLLLRDARFDQVHHQHIHYFSERSISLLLERIGFEVVRRQFDSDHYGALMLMFRRASSKAGATSGNKITAGTILERKRIFDLDVAAVNARIEENPSPILAFGAALMLPLLVYYVPALERVDFIVDDDESKEGLRFINFNKKIVHSSNCSLAGKDVVVTAISTKLALRRILERLFKLNVGNVIIPLNQV